jgi:hypothetical protein
MSPKWYRWLLVDEFINKFNEYHAKILTPSDLICVNESISHWHGQGGEWINHELHIFAAMDLKSDGSGILHSTKVLKELIETWVFTNCMVCADFNFASVESAEEQLKCNTWFIGVTKTVLSMHQVQSTPNNCLRVPPGLLGQLHVVRQLQFPGTNLLCRAVVRRTYSTM